MEFVPRGFPLATKRQYPRPLELKCGPPLYRTLRQPLLLLLMCLNLLISSSIKSQQNPLWHSASSPLVQLSTYASNRPSPQLTAGLRRKSVCMMDGVMRKSVFTWPMKCHSPQVAILIPMMIPIVDVQCLDAAGAYLDAIVSDRLEAGSALARELGLGFAAKTACATQQSVAQGLAWAMIEIVYV